MELTSLSNYQLRLKNVEETKQLKINIEKLIRDIQGFLGQDVFVDLKIEAQNLKRKSYSAVLCLFGSKEKIVVHKEANLVNTLVKKLRKLSLQKVRQDLQKKRKNRHLKPG
ncbi:MAG: hypothetical protein VX642_06320 [Bdellovibrionota bacterium]|nr:hypothetical protein [Bdellovibrionota bacterium]